MNFNDIDKKYCLFIGFEGMDASYKETNAKALYSYLKDEYFKERIAKGELQILFFSFPNYESESSYFVRQYLAGKYKEDVYNLYTVTSFYMMDMYDTLSTVNIDKPTIIVFDRYYYSQMYYLTKISHTNIKYLDNNYNDKERVINVIKNIINGIEDTANYTFLLTKLNFLFKMYSDKETMINTIEKRSKEKGKSLDEYEKDIEYLLSVREVFLNDKYINKDLLANTTGNEDILYNICVNFKNREQVFDDVKVAINNTLIKYKSILDEYWETKKDV
jgi:thymidylate kinase